MNIVCPTPVHVSKIWPRLTINLSNYISRLSGSTSTWYFNASISRKCKKFNYFFYTWNKNIKRIKSLIHHLENIVIYFSHESLWFMNAISFACERSSLSEHRPPALQSSTRYLIKVSHYSSTTAKGRAYLFSRAICTWGKPRAQDSTQKRESGARKIP